MYSAANKPVLTDGEEIRYFSVDNAGNAEAVRTSAVVRVDTVAPAVTITAPATGQHYVLGANAKAAYACTDPSGPGIASCTGAIASGGPIPTGTLGAQSLTVTVADTLGLGASATVNYVVIRPTLELKAAEHVQLASSRSTIAVGCRLNAGPLHRCTVTIRHGHT